jgi:hypothetical protein
VKIVGTPHSPHSPDLSPWDFWLFELSGMKWATIMTVTSVIPAHADIQPPFEGRRLIIEDGGD